MTIKGQRLKELRKNTFNDSKHEDTNEHIKKVLEIVDLFHIPEKWHNKTSSKAQSTETSEGLADIQAQLNNLGREIKKVNEKVYAAQVQDYALWDVIESGNSFVSVTQTLRAEDGAITTTISSPVTAEEKIKKKNDVKATSMLLMALPNEHLMNFNQYKDAKSLFAAIETSTASTQSSTASTKVSTASSQTSTANLSDATVYAFMANQSNGSQLVHEHLEQIHEDDLEEIDLKWQLALLSMRLALISLKGPRNQDSRNMYQDSSRRTVNVEETPPKAMVTIDGVGFDWSYMAEDKVPTDMALMAFSYSKFESYGPKSCEKESKNASEDILNEPKGYLDDPLVKDRVSDNKDCLVDSLVMVEKKIDVPTIAKIKVVRPKQQEKPVRPRAVNAARPRAVNTARPRAVNTARPNSAVVNAVRVNQVNAVKASACWVWRPTKPNGASITLKRHNFIDVQGYVIFGGGENGGRITGKGTLKTGKLDFEDVYFVKELKFNLLSADAVNTACYVQNKALVVKPHNKTPYELFRGGTPALSFMRPFRCHVIILNTLDHLGKFDGKAYEGYFVRYSLNSKAFNVYNIRTRRVEENFHIEFLENKPIFASAGPKWLFDINMLTKSMNYMPVIAGRNYDDFAANYLLGNGFHRGKIDQTLFIKRQKGDILLVQVYVDDIIFGSTKKELCTEFERLMKDKFQMSSMRELTFFLGLQVKQKEDGIFIGHDKYVTEVLRKFNFSDVKSSNTPVDTKKTLVKDADGNDVDVHLYRSMIGSLMYLTASRCDIMYAVCVCAKFQVTPKVSHLHVVKRIFRYLKGHPKLGLWYPKDSLFKLVAYNDSDYAGASLDMKSTTGGCQFLESRLISW
nr:uncharacterized mitochondrial protein AtMg00810-like [Tanacetum cinerariifolium]